MDDDRESEVGRQAVGDRRPLAAGVVGPVDAVVVLGVHPFRPGRMRGDLVHALPELGPRVGEEVGLDALVGRVPAATAVGGLVDPAGRHGHRDLLSVVGMGHDRVDGLPPEPGSPVRPVRVVPQRPDELEGLAAVRRPEQRRRLGAGVDHPGIVRPARLDLPDPLDAAAEALGKLHGRPLGLGPRVAEVVGAVDARPEMLTGATDEHPRGSTAGVDTGRVDALHQELRVRPGPRSPGLIRPADPQPLLRPDQQHCFGHDQPPRVDAPPLVSLSDGPEPHTAASQSATWCRRPSSGVSGSCRM